MAGGSRYDGVGCSSQLGERSAHLQQGFQAGEDFGPAFGHLRFRLQAVMYYGQTCHRAKRLDDEGDPRVFCGACCIGRESP